MCCGLGPASQVQLRQNVAHVIASRLCADEQPLCDLGVGQTLGEKLQNLEFSPRQAPNTLGADSPSFTEGSKLSMTMGVLLEMLAGLAVVAIGFLMYRVLKVVDRKLALGYPIMRVLEFVVSAILAAYLLSQLQEFPNHLLWVYIPTGIGGLILNYRLFTSRMVPRPIAVLGLIGYTLLLLVVPLDLVGAVEEGSGTGLALLLPGALYEFVILPIWLIAKGFRRPVVIDA